MAIEPSADIIGEEIRRELGFQLQHFEAIDSKAGLILGFSGVLVALSGSHLGKGVAALWALAACAALCALMATLPRSFASMNVRVLREKYLQSHARFTSRVLIDTHIQMIQEISATIQVKARWLKGAFSFLALATVASSPLLQWFAGGSL